MVPRRKAIEDLPQFAYTALVSAPNVEPFDHPGNGAQGHVVETLDDEVHAEGCCFDSYHIVAHS